jgi:IgGFc binding protein
MYPVSGWGRQFVFPDMRIPNGSQSDSIWGIVVASEDATMITFESPRPLPGLPTGPVLLDSGRALALEIHEPIATGSTTRSHFTLMASKPVEVESFMGKETGGAVVIPVDQFLDGYLLSVHPWFTGYLMVTRAAGAPVTLDGAPIPDSAFVSAGGGFEISSIKMPRCDYDTSRCGHRVGGKKIGVTVTADGTGCNYCYAGGAGAACINLTAQCPYR